MAADFGNLGTFARAGNIRSGNFARSGFEKRGEPCWVRTSDLLIKSQSQSLYARLRCVAHHHFMLLNFNCLAAPRALYKYAPSLINTLQRGCYVVAR